MTERKIVVTTRFKENLDARYLDQLCCVLQPWGEVVLLLREVEEMRERRLQFTEIMSHIYGLIRDCDLLVADISEAGYGIAAEIGMAYALGKRIVMFALRDTNMTESVMSLATVFRCLNSLEELSDLVSTLPNGDIDGLRQAHPNQMS